MSIETDILEASLVLVKTLEIAEIGIPQRVIRKLPAIEEEIDAPPMLILCPSEPAIVVDNASFKTYNVHYLVDMVFVRVGNLDLSAPDQMTDWLQTLRNAFLPPIPISVDSVWNTWVRPWSPVDRSKLNLLYDYSGITVEFVSEE